MNHAKRFHLLLALLLTLAWTSCKREQVDSDTQSSEDHAFVENESNKIVDLFDDEADENGVNKIQASYLPTCATVSVDTSSNNRSISIDFGSTNCLCSDWDGKYRRGIITASWTGPYRTAGSVITLSTTDYFVNDDEFIFNKTVTNDGANTSSNLSYTVQVTATVNLDAGGTIAWTSTRTREWVAGQNTIFNPFDDVYHLSGSASGTNRAGRNFDVNINTPLEVQVGCRWIKSGVLTISPEGLLDRIVDYGDGTCDSQATVTVGNSTFTIVMR